MIRTEFLEIVFHGKFVCGKQKLGEEVPLELHENEKIN